MKSAILPFDDLKKSAITGSDSHIAIRGIRPFPCKSALRIDYDATYTSLDRTSDSQRFRMG